MALAKIDITSLTKDLTKDLSKMQRLCIPKAEAAAELRVSRSALSRWVKGVAKMRRVKQALLRKRTRNQKTSKGRTLYMNGASLPVVIMGPKGKLPNQTKKGIRIAGRHYPHSFIGSTRLGKRPQGKTIFHRKTKARHPIREERIEIRDAVVQVGPKAVKRAIAQRYPTEFKHALDRALKRQTRAR